MLSGCYGGLSDSQTDAFAHNPEAKKPSASFEDLVEGIARLKGTARSVAPRLQRGSMRVLRQVHQTDIVMCIRMCVYVYIYMYTYMYIYIYAIPLVIYHFCPLKPILKVAAVRS